jgi:ribulose-5-phosphate 4-epimerase/fuculose-1-phosphate aldolase
MPKYAGGAYGNLSFRLNADQLQFVITASGIKDFSAKDAFVLVSKVDLDKQEVYCYGSRPPSSETMLHYLVYQQCKDINAIFHGHGETIMKLADKLGLPCTKKEEPYGTLALAQAVLEVLGGCKDRISPKVAAGSSCVLMKNHGFVMVGKNMEEAGKAALKILSELAV